VKGGGKCQGKGRRREEEGESDGREGGRPKYFGLEPPLPVTRGAVQFGSDVSCSRALIPEDRQSAASLIT